jgi:hypothetical protein
MISGAHVVRNGDIMMLSWRGQIEIEDKKDAFQFLLAGAT